MTDWRNSTGVTQDGVTTHHAAPGPWSRACGQPGDFTPQSQSEFSASHNLRHGQARMEISVRGRARDRFAGYCTLDDFTFTTLPLDQDQGERGSIYPLSL